MASSKDTQKTVVKLAPIFYESDFREKKTGLAMSAPVISRQRKSIWNMLIGKQELKLLET